MKKETRHLLENNRPHGIVQYWCGEWKREVYTDSTNVLKYTKFYSECTCADCIEQVYEHHKLMAQELNKKLKELKEKEK